MSEQYEINRFIIVGNGFDLALGMPTSYSDFFRWYLQKYIGKAVQFGLCENDLFGAKISQYHRLQLVERFQDKLSLDELRYLTGRFEFTPKPLYVQISKALDKGWLDVEHLYFEELKKVHSRRQSERKNVLSLNDQLSHLQLELSEYLKEISCEITPDPDFDYFVDDLNSFLNEDEFLNVHGLSYGDLPVGLDAYFVNFNYTDFLSQTLEYYNWSVPIFHIHGKLDDIENPIIFGYGDDMNETYQQLELESSNEYLEHIKSFRYLQTNIYHNILSIMDDAPFEVFIVGHSCGISDRTFLTTLFQHDNCRCVKIYHRGNKEEHRQKAMNISRHFTDKFKMRKRVLPFDSNATIPQAVGK